MLVLVSFVVAGCKDEPSLVRPPTTSPSSQPRVGQAVFAYAGARTFSLYHDDRAIATVPLAADGGVRDAEWTPDGARLVVATGSALYSIDTASGAMAKAGCTCGEVAVTGGTVYASEGYGATRIDGYDLTTLAPRTGLAPGLTGPRGLLRMDGAGERVVLFPITAEGARPTVHLVVLDPATGRVRDLGDTGTPSETTFSARGWRGGPTFAYVTNGSTGAQSGNDDVMWFDPMGEDKPVVTDTAPVHAKTPDVPEDSWNNTWDNLWWAADGSLHATARTWSCVTAAPLDPPECTDLVARTQWRMDGNGWAEADGHSFATRREVGAATLELSAEPGGADEHRLTYDDGHSRTQLAADVHALWTPPRSTAKPDGDDRVPPDIVVRNAPLVWLAEGEDDLPATAEDFLSKAKLIWANDKRCYDDVLAEEGEIDVGRLTTHGGYRHLASKPGRGGPVHSPNCPTVAGQEWDTLDPTRPFDGASGSPPGAQGFALDANNDLHRGAPLVDGESAAPVYYQYRENSYIFYWFFYPWNDAPYKGFDHEGDWERVSIRLGGTNEPEAMVYSGHSHYCYRDWRDVTTDDGHPVVYSATGTHASYPEPGAHLLRHVKLKGKQLPVYDHTGQGARWPTWRHLADTERSAWFGYAGGWGEVGPVTDETGPAGPYPGRNLDEVHADTPCQ